MMKIKRNIGTAALFSEFHPSCEEWGRGKNPICDHVMKDVDSFACNYSIQENGLPVESY